MLGRARLAGGRIRFRRQVLEASSLHTQLAALRIPACSVVGGEALGRRSIITPSNWTQWCRTSFASTLQGPGENGLDASRGKVRWQAGQRTLSTSSSTTVGDPDEPAHTSVSNNGGTVTETAHTAVPTTGGSAGPAADFLSWEARLSDGLWPPSAPNAERGASGVPKVQSGDNHDPDSTLKGHRGPMGSHKEMHANPGILDMVEGGKLGVDFKKALLEAGRQEEVVSAPRLRRKGDTVGFVAARKDMMGESVGDGGRRGERRDREEAWSRMGGGVERGSGSERRKEWRVGPKWNGWDKNSHEEGGSGITSGRRGGGPRGRGGSRDGREGDGHRGHSRDERDNRGFGEFFYYSHVVALNFYFAVLVVCSSMDELHANVNELYGPGVQSRFWARGGEAHRAEAAACHQGSHQSYPL